MYHDFDSHSAEEPYESTYSQTDNWNAGATTGSASEAPYSYAGSRPEDDSHRRKSSRRPLGGRLALALCLALLCGLFGAAGALYGIGYFSGDGTATIYVSDRTATILTVSSVDGTTEMTKAEVYAANVASTVGITTAITTNYFGFQTTSAASGSGFILTENGYILTCYHVVEDASSITVTLYDDSAYTAVLIGYDSSNDIAVLKIDASGLTPVVLGDSDALHVGDEVVAIGNPLGELTFSLTHGIISALNREITLSSSITMDLIQTDCAINSGNSGGALFNMYGEVIGITNAKYSSTSDDEASIDNIGFAIPINTVKEIIESIIENGYATKPYLGVSITDVSEALQAYGLPQGAAIAAVTEGSPAEEAGLQENDIITAVDGTEITGVDDLKAIVNDSEIGDVLSLTVYRQGDILTIEITVGETISSATEATTSETEEAEEETSSSHSSSGHGSSGQGTSPFGNFGY